MMSSRNRYTYIIILLIVPFLLFTGSKAYSSEYIIEESSYCGDGTCDSDEDCSNCSADCGSCGGGGGFPLDLTPPQVTNVEAAVLFDSATITWTTDEPSLSWIEYGESMQYGLEQKTSSYITFHSITITGLTPNTIYHYVIRVKDQNKNTGRSIDRTFTTISSIEELKRKIAEILAEIQRLQALLAQLQGQTEIPSGFTFNKDLKYKDNIDPDVKYLQMFLNSDIQTQLNAQPGQWGSKGKESIHFGPLTKEAVIKFQEKYSQDVLVPWGLFKGTGFVGSTTRAKLNELLGG